MQEQAKLVGLCRMAGSAVSRQVVLPCLDVVLGLAAGAVEPLIEVFGAAAFEIGDDEAGVGSSESRFDPRDEALDPAPALGGVVELRKAAHLTAPGRRPEARGGARLQRRDMAGERGVGGQAEIQSTWFARHQSNTSGPA